MSRNKYEEYTYIDYDNIYTYPDTNILINKFNEKSLESLKKKEYSLVANKILELYLQPILVHSISDIYKIHKFLFSDIYWWAGQYRKVNISKNNKPFIPIQSFPTAENYINYLISNYHRNAHSKEEISSELANILDNLNYFHPFREGNGRTQREVIRVLALIKNYEAIINVGTDDNIYNLYMDGTVYSDKTKLKILFDNILKKI